MNQTAWKLFLDASELGSLSKVALLHGTSQPHVSRQIGELERSCGGRLFQRTGRGVTLSALGARIAPQVREWLDSTEQLQNEIQNSAARPLGRVRLGIIPSVAHPFTSTLLQRLSERYPLIQMRVREGQGSQLQNWLDEGSLDLAVLLRSGPADHRNALALTATDTYLVAAAGDPLTQQPTVRFADLAGLPLVTFCRPSEWREQLDEQARRLGFQFKVQLEADSLNLQLALVARGSAYALLGGFAIAPAVAQGLVQAARVVEPAVPRHVAIAVARTGEWTLATRTVVQEAQAVARDMTEALPSGQQPAAAASGRPAPSQG
ncbi:MAG: HTH-type transcriptional regulator CynR [Pseudomonadota bacterium]|jgi:DNA-binding transcriptional LysR family regulator